MPSLRELQQAFVDGALHGDTTSIAAQIEPNGIAPERRLAIYRNNAVEGFLKTLEATFPVLVQLAGADWFRQTGRAYMRRHPSRSGNLHYVGERFAAFLADELVNSEYEYFADVARLEWAYQEVLVAAEHPSMDVSALATVSPNDYNALIFVVHPSLRLVSSSFPVLAIWKANRADAAPSAEPIRLDAGPSHLIVIRRDDHVELRELPRGAYALLEACARGEAFAAAADAALAADSELDLGAALAHVVRLGTLVDFHLQSQELPPPERQPARVQSTSTSVSCL